MVFKSFGKHPTGARLKRIEKSPNYKNGAFQNLEPTEVTLKNAGYIKMLHDYFNKPSSTVPSTPLPSVYTDLKKLSADKPTLIWFGHSSYFIRSGNYTILTDPVFSGYASPFPIMGKSFLGTDVYKVDDFPEIDLLIITHDHYDHLDYHTFLQLKNKVKHIVTPLGVGAHLEYWGADSKRITELDWWDNFSPFENVQITSTPSRHFSGRSFKRGKTLWSSFVFQLHEHKIFIGGDSGFDRQFKMIGERFGPFNIAMLDCGQYGVNWPFIHMKPEETVQAAHDLGSELLMPVHWAKFALSLHPWTEPVERVIVAAEKIPIQIITPQIGEPYTLGTSAVINKWWKA